MSELALLLSFLALLVAGASYNLSRKISNRALHVNYAERLAKIRASHTQDLGKIHEARLTFDEEIKSATNSDFIEAITANLTRSDVELKFLHTTDSLLNDMPTRLSLIDEEKITKLFTSMEQIAGRINNIGVWCDAVEGFLKKTRGSSYSL